MAINGETHDTAVRVSAQMDFCRQRCDERHGFTVKTLEEHDDRITGVEKLAWKVMGGAVVGGAVVSVITQLMVKWIGG